ncbi:hypothetical protein D3C81_1897910 [compost metagenome]
MIITPQGITADVAKRRIFQGAGKGRIGGQIVHPYTDDAKRTGQKFVRASTQHTVTRHPLHLAMVLFVQPCLQFGFTGAEIGIGNTDMLKTQLGAPLFDVLR